jgi:hypothetical protein
MEFNHPPQIFVTKGDLQATTPQGTNSLIFPESCYVNGPVIFGVYSCKIKLKTAKAEKAIEIAVIVKPDVFAVYEFLQGLD